MPEGSILYVDKAYVDYGYGDLLDKIDLHLKGQPKKLQALAFGVAGVPGEADSLVHRDGF